MLSEQSARLASACCERPARCRSPRRKPPTGALALTVNMLLRIGQKEPRVAVSKTPGRPRLEDSDDDVVIGDIAAAEHSGLSRPAQAIWLSERLAAIGERPNPIRYP